ncbi:MAG TPA: DUF1858 domain-containing protein [Patescibacteria group bacterium]|nr:DUF1858 domain-containing protein [Patescibacteria group bacterium]
MIPKGANLQKIHNGRKTYAITPPVPGGFIKPDQLEKYVQVARKYNGTLKLTSAQRIMITGLKAEVVDQVWTDLGMEPVVGVANCVRSVKICPGTAFCKRGRQDSVRLGLELDRRYHKKEMPSRLKIGVSGCPNSCAESVVKDIGVIGTDDGWDVYVGGSAGAHPRLANKLAGGLSAEETLRLIDIVVEYYKQHAQLERLGQMIERIGWTTVQRDILSLFGDEIPLASPPPQVHLTATPKLPTPVPAAGDVCGEIQAGSIIADIIHVYPQTIPILRKFGMGCLGCPSAAGEALEKAAGIHGINLDELLTELQQATMQEVQS